MTITLLIVLLVSNAVTLRQNKSIILTRLDITVQALWFSYLYVHNFLFFALYLVMSITAYSAYALCNAIKNLILTLYKVLLIFSGFYVKYPSIFLPIIILYLLGFLFVLLLGDLSMYLAFFILNLSALAITYMLFIDKVIVRYPKMYFFITRLLIAMFVLSTCIVLGSFIYNIIHLILNAGSGTGSSPSQPGGSNQPAPSSGGGGSSNGGPSTTIGSDIDNNERRRVGKRYKELLLERCNVMYDLENTYPNDPPIKKPKGITLSQLMESLCDKQGDFPNPKGGKLFKDHLIKSARNYEGTDEALKKVYTHVLDQRHDYFTTIFNRNNTPFGVGDKVIRSLDDEV